MITWPSKNMTFKEWADTLRLTRPDIDINPIVPPQAKWQAVANCILQSQVCQSMNCPRTESFKTWEDWVHAFIKTFGVNA